MAFEQRDNSGALFKNTRKEQETHADYNGTALINGVEMYVNAWVKEGKNGKFFSLSFKAKNGAAKSDKPKTYVSGKEVTDDLDDQIPF